VPGDTHYLVTVAMQRLAAALALDAGDLALARRWLEAHDRWLAWSGAILGRAERHALWARYYRAAGDARRALSQATAAETRARDPRQPIALLDARRTLGELATDAETAADAEAHLLGA